MKTHILILSWTTSLLIIPLLSWLAQDPESFTGLLAGLLLLIR